MIANEIKEEIKNDEYHGELLINKFRFALGIIYVLCVLAVSVLRQAEGLGFLPLRAFSFTSLFLIYSIILFFYIKKKNTLHPWFKYIAVILDMLIISAAIWTGCTYLEEAPPLPFLSIQALFYMVLIMAGSFRYSVPCAYFSGFFSSVCYLIVVVANRNVLDLPYFFVIEGRTIPISFPIYNEFFRVIGLIVIGVIAGIACKRHLKLLTRMISSQTKAAESASKTVDKTRAIALTIGKSTDDIFLSSKNIFQNANNQAASVQEIESTIKENSQISGEIAEKTSNVADVAVKMENDAAHGFNVLERNVTQLENIKNKNDNVIAGIVSLGNKISKIRGIINTINNITDQTKVIAFNAALEAASAGDAGKRFAVVASEVNRLAGDITALTKQIRQQAEEMQSSSSSLMISSEESAEKIIEGNNLIKELEDIFREVREGAEIAAAQAQTITISTQKQQKSSEQINIAIKDISNGLSNFIQSTRLATSSAKDLTQLVDKLDLILTNE